MPPSSAVRAACLALAAAAALLAACCQAHADASTSGHADWATTLFPSARRVRTLLSSSEEAGSTNSSSKIGLLLPLGHRPGQPLLRGRTLKRSAVAPVGGNVRNLGYFYTVASFGTPPKPFQLIISTGSTVTYVPCADCKECGRNHRNPPFDIKQSSTAVQLACNSRQCNCGTPACQCRENKCTYAQRYGEGSASQGFLLEDVMAFNDTANTWPAPPAAAPPPVRVVFGCESVEQGEIYRQVADGLMGLGNDSNALQSQLVAQNVIEDTFYLCFGYPSNGVLLLGDVKLAHADKMVYAGFLPMGTSFYTVVIGHMEVAGQLVIASVGSFAQGFLAVLDSGTTFTYLPSVAFQNFAAMVDKVVTAKGLKRSRGPDPAYNDICWAGAPPNTPLKDVYPEVSIVFLGGAKLKWRPLQYLFEVNSTSHCLGVFDYGGQSALLGAIAMQNVLVQYDRRNSRAGFLPLDSCQDVYKLVEDANPPQQPQPAPPYPPSRTRSSPSPPAYPAFPTPPAHSRPPIYPPTYPPTGRA